MKLIELTETAHDTPMYAWLQPGMGPNNMQGVELQFLQPVEKLYGNLLRTAEHDKRPTRIKQLTAELEAHRKKNIKYMFQTIDWWKNRWEFDEGRDGKAGFHRGEILAKFPQIRIVDSKEAAIKAADEAGLK